VRQLQRLPALSHSLSIGRDFTHGGALELTSLLSLSLSFSLSFSILLALARSRASKSEQFFLFTEEKEET